MTQVHMNRMSWTHYRDRIARDRPPVFLPVGALEQHIKLSSWLTLSKNSANQP